ncbi:hypothetical protein [Burkholderia anthina]|uniref:hypothetical protein n=1 Tax=Burkholderia anthina TaxID=179879 RepID=UPI00158C0FF0|nr:hypothetical protein [Burkholderia anthina]
MTKFYQASVKLLTIVCLALLVLVLLGVISRLHEDADSANGVPVVEFRAPGVRCFSWRSQFACVASDGSASESAPATDSAYQSRRSST